MRHSIWAGRPVKIMNDIIAVSFEALDMDVEWDGETQTAIGIGEGIRIELPVGASVAYVNGEGNTLDAPAVIYNDRTLVPLRFIAEAVGADVSWDSGMRIVRVSM